MVQYIEKSSVIAEIEKRIKEIDEIGTYLSPKGILTNLLCHLNTLEAKEVDLDESARHYLLHEHISPLNEVLHQADLKVEMQYHEDIEKAFKAGFERGLKEQKGGEK